MPNHSLDLVLEDLVVGSARGRKALPLGLAVERELDEEDVPAILNPQALGTKPPSLGKLRESHHMIARLVAEGKKNRDIAAIMGYHENRISTLQDDPAFQNLVAYYREQVDAKYMDVHERLAILTGEAVDILLERMDDNPSQFSHKDLREIIETAGDRSVAPAKGTKGQSPAGGVRVNIQFVEAEPKGQLLHQGQRPAIAVAVEEEED